MSKEWGKCGGFFLQVYMMHLGFGNVQAIELLNYMIKIHMRRMSNVQNENQIFQEVVEATHVGKQFREEKLYSYDTQIWIPTYECAFI